MKKLGLLVMPLMVVSLLASCGSQKPSVDQFTVTFDANSGTLSGESSIKVNSGTSFKDIANKPTASKQPIELFPFNGWGLTEDTQIPIDDYKITGDLTVYAIYTPKATATVYFSAFSQSCKLSYKGAKYQPNSSFLIPADVDIELDISKDSDDLLPVFETTLIVEDTNSYDFDGVNQKIIVNVPKDSTCTIAATAVSPKENLEAYEWTEISQLSRMGLAKRYFDIYDPTKPTLNCKKVQLKSQDTNNNGEIDDNEFYQTVQIIGFEQDYTNPNDRDNTKVGITFDFTNLISDDTGSYLACVWNDTSNLQECNYHYDTSTIFKNLNDEKEGTARWYEHNKTVKSTKYKNSVLSMLPDDLAKAIIPVSKNVNINDGLGFKETPITSKLFLLCPKEMGTVNEDVLSQSESDAPVYKFYEGCLHDEEGKKKLVKRQTNNAENVEGRVGIDQDDLECKIPGFNTAGHIINYSGQYYFRSPIKSDTVDKSAWFQEAIDLSRLNDSVVPVSAHGVAPAFCI